MTNLDSIGYGDSFKLNDVGLVFVKRFYLVKQGVFACWCKELDDFIELSPSTLVERI